MVSSDLLVRCFLVARTTSRPEQLSLVPPQNRFRRRPLQRPPASRLQAMDADAASHSRAACHSASYKGIGQAVTDVIGGQIPMLSANATAQILDLHRAGKVRILSVKSQ